MSVSHSGIVFYKAKDGSTAVDVRVEDETVWLNQKQMARLFAKNVRTVSEHINNIFKEAELKKKRVIRKFRITGDDGKAYEVQHYNLDVIISVGYRVKSKQGTQFRQWATKVLREHLLKGFSLNQRHLQAHGVKDLHEALGLLEQTLLHHELAEPLGVEVVRIIREYAKTWNWLLAYDEAKLKLPKTQIKTQPLIYQDVMPAIQALKDKLIEKQEASNLFAREFDQRFSGILLSLEQTFQGKALYSSVQEKAAHLLYFIIKDHPFIDGNKRVACFMLLLYLQMHRLPWHLNDRGLTALALLIAESQPTQKDILIRLIVNLLQ